MFNARKVFFEAGVKGASSFTDVEEEKKKKKETRMTASVLKQDLNR